MILHRANVPNAKHNELFIINSYVQFSRIFKQFINDMILSADITNRDVIKILRFAVSDKHLISNKSIKFLEKYLSCIHFLGLYWKPCKYSWN